ncbi:MAG: hypothetical protein LPK36_07590, partial [Actinomycetes bacterium]|nr:hypothetical protein [Actinomycetes bacterium]
MQHPLADPSLPRLSRRRQHSPGRDDDGRRAAGHDGGDAVPGQPPPRFAEEVEVGDLGNGQWHRLDGDQVVAGRTSHREPPGAVDSEADAGAGAGSRLAHRGDLHRSREGRDHLPATDPCHHVRDDVRLPPELGVRVDVTEVGTADIHAGRGRPHVLDPVRRGRQHLDDARRVMTGALRRDDGPHP